MKRIVPFKNIIIALVVFAFFTLLFWQIFPSPRKNDYIIFYIAIILILYLSLCFNRIVEVKFDAYKAAFLKFIIMSLLSFLFILVFFCVNELIILKIVLSIVVTSIVPGYLFARLIKLTNMGSLETLIFAFCLSIPINAAVFIFGTIIHSINEYYLLMVYGTFMVLLFMVGISSLRHEKEVRNDSQRFICLPRLFILLWVVSFFVYAIIMNYPQTALKPADDLFNHWGISKKIISAFQTRGEAIADSELLYHIQWATVMLLTNLSTTIFSMAIFQSFMALLSIFNILSFYMMCKCYLKRINQNLAPLATLFWTVFSGFGWVYCLRDFFGNHVKTDQYFDILLQDSGRTYFDTCYGNGPWVWLWYRPLTLGLTLFFTLMYLLSNNKVSRKKLILVSSILLITLNLTHFPESFIFSLYVFLLSILKLFKPRMNARTQDVSLSIGISMLVTVLFVSLQKVFVVYLPSNLLVSFCITGFFMSFVAKEEYEKKNFWLSIRVKNLLRNRSLYAIIIAVYLSFILVCLEVADTFSIALVQPFVVPFVFYPFLMGVTGILALMSFKSLIEDGYVGLIPVAALLFIGVLIGKVISLVNVNIFYTGYWERRIILVTYAPLCVLASISFQKFNNLSCKKIHRHLGKSIITIISIALLVLSGVFSTFLAIDCQTYISQKRCLGQKYSSTIESLGQLEYNTILLTVTDYSWLIARIAPVRWVPRAFRYHVLEATNPELPLNAMFQQGSCAVLYFDKQDITELRKRYTDSYIANHILPLYDTPNATYPLFIHLPKSTPPSFKSSTVFVLPKEVDEDCWYIYDALSQAQVNYTTSLFDDLKTIFDAETVIAPSEDVALQLIKLKRTFSLKCNSIIVFNVNGYGELSNVLFDEPKMNIESENGIYVIASNRKFKNTSSILKVLNFTLIDENLIEPERLTLLDESLDDWVCKGSGSGTISEPSIYLNSTDSVVGNKSITIKVDDGIYEQWIIYKDFAEKLELGDFDFITFYWFGQNNDLRYVLQFETDSDNYYWYEFTDNWCGWKNVYIPMWCEDGIHNFNNVTFTKVTNGHPTWNTIKRVVIKLSGANVNIPGTYKIDGLGFESTKYATVYIKTHVKIDNFKIGVADNFINIKGTGLYETSLPYVVNKVNLYGNKTTVKINFTRTNNETIISISCKLIPFGSFYKSPSFTFEPPSLGVNVSRIDFSNEVLELPAQISVLPLKTSKEMVARYAKNIPFIIKHFDEETGLNVVYVNFYPLIKNIRTTFNVIGKIIEYSHLLYSNSSPCNSSTSKLPPENAVVFREGILSGKVQIEAESLMLFNITKGIVLCYDGKNETLMDVMQVNPLYFRKASINAESLLISGGAGFYSNLYLRNAVISFLADEDATVIFHLRNGSLYVVRSDKIEVYADEANMLARFPNIILDGQAFLYDVYAYPNLNKVIRPDGVNGRFVGLVKFKIIFGETYVISEDFNFDGQYFPSEQIYTFNDLDTLLRAVVYVPLLLTPLIIYTITPTPKENKETDKVNVREHVQR